MDDLRAVMDAVGSRRAAIFGVVEGAPMALLFAATYPERVAALVLRSALSRTMWAPDYPWGRSEEQARESVEGGRSASTGGARRRRRAPARWPSGRTLTSRRSSTTSAGAAAPGAVEELAAMNREIDVRHVLPAIRVPTLVIHGVEDRVVPLEAARWMTERIPGARLVEVAGAGHLHFGRGTDAVNAEVERSSRTSGNTGAGSSVDSDRVLATVLFTDIVDSSDAAGRARRPGVARAAGAAPRDRPPRARSAFAARRSIRRATGSSRASTAPREASAVRARSSMAVTELGIEVRAGLHTGECEVVDGKVAGIAVHTGARVASQAGAGEVLVSSTVKDLVAGSGIAFADRGVHELKGVPGEWQLFAVDRVTA